MKIVNVLFCIFIIFISCVASMSSYTLPAVPPMPPEMMEAMKSGGAASPATQNLLGRWESEWIFYGANVRPVRKVAIVIFRIEADKIHFLYGSGDSPESKYPGGWVKETTELSYDSDGASYFQFYGSAAWIRFSWREGRLSGNTGFGINQYMADFQKVSDLP